MAKSNETKQSVIESTIDLSNPNNGRLTLAFSNGRIINIAMSDLTPEIATQALMHGLKQKLVDAAAIARNPDTGLSATVADKFNAVSDVYTRLVVDKSWNAVREGGGNAGGLLLQALVRLQGKTAEQVKTWLETKSDTEKAALRKNPKVAEIILAIQAEKAKDSGIDTDALLDELNDDEAGE